MAGGYLADFAGAEFALVEFARDGKIYADILGAVSVAFVGEASLGKVVTVQAQAGLGVSTAPGATAVTSAVAEGEAAFDALAEVAYALTASAQATWRHSGSASAGYAVSTSGAATLTFDALAESLSGETFGEAYWRWGAVSVASAVTRFEASGTFGFMATPSMTALTTVQGLAMLTFSPVGDVSAVKQLVGNANLRFVAAGHTGSDSDSDSQAAWVFDAAGRVSAVWTIPANAQLTITALADITLHTASPMRGTAYQEVVAVAYTQVLAATAALTSVRFTGTGGATRIVNARGQASLAFLGDGRPGAPVFSTLPASRARFAVAPRPPAFVVPPEPELEKV